MRRPLVVVLVVGAITVALAIIAAVFIGQAVDRAAAVAEHRTATERLETALTETQEIHAEAVELDAYLDDPYLPAQAAAAVVAERVEVEAVRAEAARLLDSDVDRLDTEAVRDTTRRTLDAATTVRTESDDLDGALSEVVAAASSRAAEIEAAAFDATNAPRVAYREAVAALDLAVDAETVEYLGAYLGAAHALTASHSAELAEKAGPLFDARMAVQQFARSIAGGVMLEFDWRPIVNGYGANGSYGGTSYWTTEAGGQSTLTLSDSVAAQWPRAGVQSLVAHEVGHAVLARKDCNALYFESDLYPGEEESWATAWAIGMGYTADGSGETVYGRPSDALIALSQQCR